MLFGRSGGISWLVVGLGNPGTQYESTRHNMGFLAVDKLAQEENFRFSKLRFKAWTATWEVGGQKVLVMKPQTYMNNSGEAVAPAAKFYKVPPEHILVVSDEIHLQPGRLRIRTKGSAGGHNGLKSIIACLGTDAFPRIRIGVGAPPHPDYDMPDWVLGTFRGADKTAMDDAAARAAEACAVYIRDGADRAMSRFN